MQAAIRWSPHSTPSRERFLLLNLTESTLKLFEVTNTKTEQFAYTEVSHLAKLPQIRAFDWSPTEHSLIAIGQPSGEASLVRLEPHPTRPLISFPVKHQRACNAVAFNTDGKLAAGLDKVRNDYCLNIWDVNQRLGSDGTKIVAPLKQLTSSDTVGSVKFFPDNPNKLVAGISGRFLKIYDLNCECSFDFRRQLSRDFLMIRSS
jgi:WD repeat-containing protein mio